MQYRFFRTVGDNNKTGDTVFILLLAHSAQRNPLLCESGRQIRQNSGAIDHFHVDMVARVHLAEISDWQVCVSVIARCSAAMHFIPGSSHEVAQHGRSSWVATGTITVEHQRTSGFCLHEDRVIGLINRGQRVIFRHQSWVHPRINGVVALIVGDLFTDSKQLNDIPCFICSRDVCSGDVTDTFTVHIFEVDARIEPK